MVSLVPPLAALALAIHALSAPCGGVWKRPKRRWWAAALALALAAYSTFEICLAPQLLLTLALPPLATYLAVGMILMLVNLTEMARRGGEVPQARLDVVRVRRESAEARMKSRDDLQTAIRIGGPVCVESTSPVRSAVVMVKGDADCAPAGTWMTALLPVDALLWIFPALVFVLATLCRKGPTVFASQPQQEPHRHFATDKDYWESLGVSTGVAGAKPAPAAETPHRHPAMQAKPETGRAQAVARPDAFGVPASDKRARRRKEHELLSEAAFVAGHFVEAYFWAFKAKKEGSQAMTRTMAKCCSAWIRNGRHSERGNVTERFTAKRGSFARAALRIQCGTDVQASRKRIKALAKDGLREAKQYLEDMER